MQWTIVKHEDNADYEFTIPFECNQRVYYVHKKKWWKEKSEWVVSVHNVTSVWATSVYGVTLSDGTQISYHEFDYLFTNKEDAIEYCLKKNTHEKVKVYWRI